MKTKEINGRIFEVIHSSKTDTSIIYHERNFKYRTLDNFYDRPSIYKREIWEEWYDWYRETDDVHDMEVTGANCMTFSIGAIWTDENGEIAGYIWITKDHNRLYLRREE